MKDLSRNVSLHCPVCGNTMFSNVDKKLDNTNLREADDSILFRCSDCGNVISKGDLLRANEGTINANIQDIETGAVKAMEKEMKKALRGIKGITIK